MKLRHQLQSAWEEYSLLLCVFPHSFSRRRHSYYRSCRMRIAECGFPYPHQHPSGSVPSFHRCRVMQVMQVIRVMRVMQVIRVMRRQVRARARRPFPHVVEKGLQRRMNSAWRRQKMHCILAIVCPCEQHGVISMTKKQPRIKGKYEKYDGCPIQACARGDQRGAPSTTHCSWCRSNKI